MSFASPRVYRPEASGSAIPLPILGAVAAASVLIWFLPQTLRLVAWGGVAALAILLIPLLWREGYTWVILWVAPVAAFEPFTHGEIRIVKYAIVAAALVIAATKRLIGDADRIRVQSGALWVALLWLIWLWIRGATSNDPVSGFAEAGRLSLVAALVYMWATEPVRAGGRKRWYVLWMLMGLYQVGACLIEASVFGHLRSYGTFPNANALGMYLILAISIAFATGLGAPKRAARISSLAITVLLLFGLYLTGARAAWLATAAALLLVALLLRRWRWILLGAGLLGFALTLYLSNPMIRVATDAALRLQTGLTHRPLLWEAADRARERAPIIGFGLEASGAEMMREARYPSPVHRQITADMFARGSAHNFYREIQLEAGLIGFVLFVAVVLGILIAGWRARRTADPWRRTYAVTLIAVTLAVLLHAYFETSVFIGSMSASIFYWFLVVQSVRPDEWSPSHRAPA